MSSHSAEAAGVSSSYFDFLTCRRPRPRFRVLRCGSSLSPSASLMRDTGFQCRPLSRPTQADDRKRVTHTDGNTVTATLNPVTFPEVARQYLLQALHATLIP